VYLIFPTVLTFTSREELFPTAFNIMVKKIKLDSIICFQGIEK